MEKGGAPWVALVLLDQDQLVFTLDQNNSDNNARSLTGTILRPLKEVRNGNSDGILGPLVNKLDYAQSDQDVWQTIDISTDIFQQLIPRIDELQYLVHCRQVDVKNKEIIDMKHSGYYSIVVSNRFPSC